MATTLPSYVDTVIVGNGPSALILSYILHGHIPYYSGSHHDAILHSKLSTRPNLLDLTADLYAHFQSSLRYSTDALPINTLLDTLIRPNADTESNPQPCIEWRNEPRRAISHIAIGDAAQAGGQWADNPISASWKIGTLSYAEMLSLPGYSYSDHYAKIRKEPMPDFVRPSRAEVADYYKAYPAAVRISNSIVTSKTVSGISRTSDGFQVTSHNVYCKNLVLASGIFTVNIPPPKLLAPLTEINSTCDPLLVIGSGFSAADVILSTPPSRKIIHIFQWKPSERPSPLRGCHSTAYPEYATIYRQMKLAAMPSGKRAPPKSPLMRRKSNPFFNCRDWTTFYEGFPNATVIDITGSNSRYVVNIKLESGDIVEKHVGHLEYVVGRRGSLNYLDQALQTEILGTSSPNHEPHSSGLISARTLRAKAEVNLEVAPHVFIIGSLAGDSLVRHAVGGCVYAAARIMDTASSRTSSSSRTGCSTPARTKTPPKTGSPLCANGNAHQDLHLDRRKLKRSVDIASAENRVWAESGWWGGGCRMP